MIAMPTDAIRDQLSGIAHRRSIPGKKCREKVPVDF